MFWPSYFSQLSSPLSDLVDLACHCCCWSNREKEGKGGDEFSIVMLLMSCVNYVDFHWEILSVQSITIFKLFRLRIHRTFITIFIVMMLKRCCCERWSSWRLDTGFRLIIISFTIITDFNVCDFHQSTAAWTNNLLIHCSIGVVLV